MTSTGPSDPRYRVLVDALDEGFVFQDSTGVVVFSNPAASRILGVSADQLAGRTTYDSMWHAEFEDGSHEPDRHPSVVALETGQPVSNVVMRVTASETHSVWVSINAWPVFDGNDAVPSGVVVSFTDISEQRGTERALRESVRRFRMLFEATDDAVHFFDTDTMEFLDFNDAFVRLYGYRRDELATMSIMDLSAEPDETRRLAGSAVAGETYRISNRLHRRRDGTTFPVAISAGAFELDGRLVGYALVRDISERVAAEEAVRQSERRLTSLLEHSNDVILVLDQTGTLTYVSPSAPVLFGFPYGSHLGAAVYDLVHPDDRKRAREALLERVATTERREPLELRLKHADGGWRHIELVASNFIDDPAINGIVLNLRDITERRQAESAMRESEERLQALLHHSSDIIVVTDGAGVLQLVSPAAQRMLGFEIAPWIGRNVLDLIHPDDRDQAALSLANTAEVEGTHPPLKLRVANADGSWRPVEVLANNLLDSTPIEGIVFNIRDISERLHAEAALRESELRYRMIVELAQEGIWTIDAEAQTTYANDRMGQLLGHAASDMIGVHLFEFMDEEGRGIAEENLERRKAGLSENHDFKFTRGDGTALWTIMSTSPILGDDDEYLGALALVTDVTERRAVEAALREAELDGQRREAELERNRLEAELMRAQRLESLGRLAGGVAHDFNNLLGVILNYAGFVAKRLDPADPIADDVLEIRRAAERATDLTRQLLLFGRREVVRAAEFDLNDVVDAAIPMLRRTLGDVELAVELAPHPIPVFADRGQIEQVLMNLLLNARDATTNRGTITVRTARRNHDNGTTIESFAELSVRDDGEGMTADVLDQAFEPFFTTKSRDRGSGLGLASVHGIVTRAGGDVAIASRPAVGTTVTVTLALADVSGPARQPDPAETVLLVDDEPNLRATTARMLRENGFRVVEARTGAEALLRARAEATDATLLLTDVVMPEMSGPELARELLATRPHLKVLLMSGYAHDELQTDDELVTALLAKPFTEEQLLQAVQSALRRRSARPALRA